MLEILAKEKGDSLFYKKDRISQEDIDFAANRLAVEVAFALAEEIEELNTSSAEFRGGLIRVAKRALNYLFTQPERCVVMTETLPGFTAMAFKKEAGPKGPESGRGGKNGKSGGLEPSPAAQEKAAALIVEKYLEKKKGRVMAIESPEVLLLLFPVSDTRKNLKQAGFYITD